MTTLAQLLDGRRLLVSAPVDQQILVHDGEWQRPVPLDGAHGIAVKGDLIHVACKEGIVTYDADFNKQTTNHRATTGYELVTIDDELFVADPKVHAVLDVSNPLAETVKWQADGWVNGIGVCEKSPRYVTMLGVRAENGEWTDLDGKLFDTFTGEVVIQGLTGPHSPRWHNDQVYFLDSVKSELCAWTPGDQDFSVVTTLHGWTRGLAFFDHYAIVGTSQGRYTAWEWAHVDATAQPGLSIVDLTNGETVHFESLAVHEIFDVQVA